MINSKLRDDIISRYGKDAWQEVNKTLTDIEKQSNEMLAAAFSEKKTERLFDRICFALNSIVTFSYSTNGSNLTFHLASSEINEASLNTIFRRAETESACECIMLDRIDGTDNMFSLRMQADLMLKGTSFDGQELKVKIGEISYSQTDELWRVNMLKNAKPAETEKKPETAGADSSTEASDKVASEDSTL